jgi:hypothetical protein
MSSPPRESDTSRASERADASALRFRFRPARPVQAVVAGVMGAVLVASSLVAGPMAGRGLAIALGGVVAVLAVFYLLSPAWRNEVVVDEAGLEVRSRGDRRFRLAWSEVVRVVAAPASASAFVDGGDPQRSLLLPGPGARAPYRIAHQDRLFDQIRARVPPDRVTEVDKLGRHGGAHA